MSVLTLTARILIGRKINPYNFNKTEGLCYKPRINDVGLYIHIPFCRKICNFCPYNKILYDRELAKEYILALKRELALIKQRLPLVRINSIYLGGGTPSLLKEGLAEIFKFVRDKFEITGDIGIEVHPGDSEKETLNYLKRIGISLVSVGIQSFDKEILQKLTRHRIEYDLKESLLRILATGFNSVDVDLIFGMKGVSLEKNIKDFNTAIDLGCDQVSMYPLIPFTFTPIGKKHFDKKNIVSSEKERTAALSSFIKIAKIRNYERSSVWSFTKKGSTRYSSITRNSFIGIGAGATSMIGNLFTVNTFSISEYIKESNKRIPSALCCNLSERDEMLWWLFWQCYNTKIISDEFEKLFKKDLYVIFRKELNLGIFLGILIKEGNDFHLTQKGSSLFHLVEQEYTHSYLDKMWRSCMFDPWPKRLTLN